MSEHTDGYMPEYNESTIRVQRQAFKQLFSVTDEILDEKAIRDWMGMAPILIVEYSELLPGEDKLGSDRRREMKEIYDGDIANLVKHLRSVYTDRGDYHSWALIFSVANEISSADDAIEQAITHAAFSDDEPIAAAPKVEPEVTTPKVEPEVKEEDHQSKLVEENKVPLAKKENEASVTATGNVQSSTSAGSYISNNIKESSKEEVHMDLQNIKDAANAAAGSVKAPSINAGNAANLGSVKNSNAYITSPDQLKPNAKTAAAIASKLADEGADRMNRSKTDTVTQIVVERMPAARRLSDPSVTKGILQGTEDPKLAEGKIKDKMTKFVKAVTGKDGMTIDTFKSLSDNDKYANVVAGTAKDSTITYTEIAKAIYSAYETALQDINKEFEAVIPEVSNLSYPAKGYVVNGKAYSEDEMLQYLMRETAGFVYANGSFVNGAAIEKATRFKTKVVAKAEPTKSNQKQNKAALAGQVQKKAVIKVVVSNKKTFTSDPSNVVAAFTTVVDNAGYSPFTAKVPVTVNGETVSMPATIKVYSLKDGRKQQTEASKKGGELKYKTKAVSMKVLLHTQTIDKREPDAAFAVITNGEYDPNATKAKWGFAVASTSEDKLTFGESPLIEALTVAKQTDLKLLKDPEFGASIEALINDATKVVEQLNSAEADLLNG